MTDFPRTLYHGCRRSALESILAHGLDPAFSKSGLLAVYMTDDWEVAAGYWVAKNDPENEWVILSIHTRDLVPHLFGPDDYELADVLLTMSDDELDAVGLWPGANWKECSPELSLELCNQVAYFDVIPPTAIEVLSHASTRDPAVQAP